MSQRQSGYIRKELDAYQTPEWVTAQAADAAKGKKTDTLV